jgi:hypothetical protein
MGPVCSYLLLSWLIWKHTFLLSYCCIEVHCDIYKSSHNISWLNSSPPSK